jgi:hypothetical protein
MWWLQNFYTDDPDTEGEPEIIVDSDAMVPWAGGYGGGCSYGGDLLQALAFIQGLRIESV